MKSYHFEVYGDPVAKGRPRIVTTGKFARAYTPAKTVKWEDSIKLQAIAQLGRIPLLENALGLRLQFKRQFPKSMSKKRRLNALPTTRPDLDNYVKAVKDALNGILWKDDSQIVRLKADKVFCDRPGIEITVWEIEI